MKLAGNIVDVWLVGRGIFFIADTTEGVPFFYSNRLCAKDAEV